MPSWTQYAFYGMLIGAALLLGSVVADLATRSMRRGQALRRLDESAVRERGKATLLRVAPIESGKFGPLGDVAAWCFRLYAQGGSQPTPTILLLSVAATAIVSFMLFNGAINNTLASGALALGAGILAPLFLLLRNRAKRRAK